MSAPVKSFLVVGAAFAAGVMVTAAYVGAPSEKAGTGQGMMGGAPEAAAPTQPRTVAGLTPASRVSEASSAPKGAPTAEAWVDPVKQTTEATGTPPRPPLVFHVDHKRAEAGTARQAEAPVVPPRRPKASEFLAKAAGHADPEAAPDAANRIAASRPSGVATSRKAPAPRRLAGSQRRPSGLRVAASEAERDDEGFAVEQQARRAPFARRDFTGWPADPSSLRNPDGVDRYERDVADRPPVMRRRVTAAETGGVLRWLEVP